MIKPLIDLLGWAGAVVLLLAYGCVSFQKLRADSLTYQVLNALGSLCLVINTVFYHAYPSAFVNVVWITIAIAARARLKRGQRQPAGT